MPSDQTFHFTVNGVSLIVYPGQVLLFRNVNGNADISIVTDDDKYKPANASLVLGCGNVTVSSDVRGGAAGGGGGSGADYTSDCVIGSNWPGMSAWVGGGGRGSGD